VPIIIENTSKWKINMGKLDYLRDPRCLNWMQYVRYSKDLLFRNLMPFQYENQLFYQSTRLIEEGEELLVWFENGNAKDNNYIQLSVIKEKLEDVYACIFCCLGFNAATFLLKHNTVCPGKKDKNLSFKESLIVQCTFCKIYLLESEYSEVHLGRCCTRKAKLLTARSRINESDPGRRRNTWKRKRNDLDDDDLTDRAKKYDCSLCEYETKNKHHFMRHLYTHSETKLYRCPKCPYRSKTKYYIGDHLRRKHADRISASGYACPLCSECFKRVSLLQIHVRISHNDNRSFKCPKCQFRTSNKKLFLRHYRSAHAGARPYRCHSCPKRFTCEKSLRSHVTNLHVDANRTKRFKCPKCDRFETKYEASLRKHLLNVHGGVKRFRCGECPYATAYKLSLERHLCLHQNGVTVECECADCGEKFVTRTELAAHVRQQHKPPDNVYR
ncbi:zinc finger protein, partial [Oryctes borbonicus]